MEGVGFFIQAKVKGKTRYWCHVDNKFNTHGKGVSVFPDKKMANRQLLAIKDLKDKSVTEITITPHKDLLPFVYHPDSCTSCRTKGGKELAQIKRWDLFNKENLKKLFVKYANKRGKDLIVWKGSSNCTCLDCLKDYTEGKIDEWGFKIKFVKVKCPDKKCNHIQLVDMRYLCWDVSCNKCRHTLTVNDRVKKTNFNMRDYR